MPRLNFMSALRKTIQKTVFPRQMLERRERKMSYSQFGEDVHLRSFYDLLAEWKKIKVQNGCIVDVGAYRPIAWSNTYYFYRRGWHCINIDPTPGSMRPFDKVRPRDTNLEIAIAGCDGSGTFYVFEPDAASRSGDRSIWHASNSVWNTMDAEAAQIGAKAVGVQPRAVEIQVRRLETILDRYLQGRSFELLSIDAEGLDLEILKSNDFDKYRPRLILIEVHGVSLETLAQHPVVTYLSAFDYHLYSWINPNLLFVRADSLIDFGREADARNDARKTAANLPA